MSSMGVALRPSRVGAEPPRAPEGHHAVGCTGTRSSRSTRAFSLSTPLDRRQGGFLYGVHGLQPNDTEGAAQARFEVGRSLVPGGGAHRRYGPLDLPVWLSLSWLRRRVIRRFEPLTH